MHVPRPTSLLCALTSVTLAACGDPVPLPPGEVHGVASPLAPFVGGPGQVVLRGPFGPPSVLLGIDPGTGAEIRGNCTTCHATRPGRRATARGDELDEFHQGLVMEHGGSTCLTCHDEASYDRLRLADGRPVAFTDSMRLCGQCHGPQLRDWERGSHGGMAGHWDLSRGPRERNHCVQCHDPHAPKILPVLPAPPPNDRFLSRAQSEVHHD